MTHPPLSNMQARDVATLIHPYTNLETHRQVGPQMLERGEGIYVFDDQGRRFIDGLSGLWCAGLGYNDPELVEAAVEQLNKLPYYHLFGGKSYEPAVALGEQLKEVVAESVPDSPVAQQGARVFFCASGSEANDTQVKLAWYYNNAIGRPKKKKIISRVKAYHGVTLMAASLTGLPYTHTAFDLPFDMVRHVSTPHYWRGAEPGETEADFVARLIAELRALIEAEDPETIAAFIAEPVMGAGGVVIPPEGYYPAVCDLMAEHDIRVIDDEVICGFGRTGKWLGAETLGMRPHAVSFAKQLTSAYAPLSAVVIDGDVAEAVTRQSGEVGVFGHGYTYGGHPLGCAVGLKTLEIYRRRNIPARVTELAPVFRGHLERLAQHPLVGEMRAVGLIGALELAPDRSGKKAFHPPMKVGPRAMQELLARGVITRAIGDSLAFCPPMIIEPDQLDELFSAVEPALDATLDWARREGFYE